MEFMAGLRPQLELSFVLWCQGDDPSGQLSRAEHMTPNRELMPEARPLSEPAIVYDVFLMSEVREEAVALDDGSALHGRLLAGRFFAAQELALASCTIGGTWEDRVSAHRTNGDGIRALLLDGMGMAAVGVLGDKTHELVRDRAAVRASKASAHLTHPCCPVPTGIFKAIELELELALPKDVALHFEATDRKQPVGEYRQQRQRWERTT